MKPYIRFKGEAGEQATMFFLDPSGNAIVVKAFANLDSLSASSGQVVATDFSNA